MPGDLDDGRPATPGRGRYCRRRRAQERLVATEHPPAPIPPGARRRCSVACGSSRSASTSPRRWPPRSSPTSARRWSRSSGRAATRCGPTPPASPPGTGARRRSSSTCARRPAPSALRDLVDEADLLVENLRPGCAGAARAGAGHAASRAPAAGHLLHQRLGLRRAVARRAGMGAARARPGRRAAGPLHRGRPDLAPLPRGQRVGRAGGRPRRRRRADQARLDRLRPARRDVAPRCAALPQRRAPSSTARDTGPASCARPSRRSCASSTRPTAAPSWST